MAFRCLTICMLLLLTACGLKGDLKRPSEIKPEQQERTSGSDT